MSYWTNRQEQLKKTAEKDESAIKKRLSKFYDAEFKRLDKEIAAYYQKYGEDNVIEYRQLMESLSDEDKRLLMQQMDEFATKYPQYADLMPVRESIYKLDRLQGLQCSVSMAQANIAGYTNEQIKEYETSLAQKGLNYAMETLGFGSNFYSINSDVVKQFIDVAWSNGENFSTRIWNDTQKLAQYLNQDMAQGFARGDSYDRLVRNLKKRFDRVNRNDAYRLVFTEGTYVMAESTMQPFKEDFEQYRLSPVLDGRTCPICRGLREQVFLISERQPGVNFPPIHPWCRCSWEIVVDDWDKWIDDYVEKHGGGSGETVEKSTVEAAEKIEKRLKNDDKNGIIKKRKQYDAYDEEDPKGSDKRALELMRKETGYSAKKCKEIKSYMDDYFMGNYKEFIDGQRPEESKAISDALRKMQPYDGEIYRGLSFADRDRYTAYIRQMTDDSDIKIKALQSWTSREKVARRFGSYSDDADTVILVCKNNESAVGVRHISQLGSSEDEVLAPENVTYKLANIREEFKDGNENYKIAIIELEEV